MCFYTFIQQILKQSLIFLGTMYKLHAAVSYVITTMCSQQKQSCHWQTFCFLKVDLKILIYVKLSVQSKTVLELCYFPK